MARKPNYAFERNARAKAKAAKREAKRQAKQVAKAKKAGLTSAGETADDSPAQTGGIEGSQDHQTDVPTSS